MALRRPLIIDSTTSLDAEIATGDVVDPTYTGQPRLTVAFTSSGSPVTGTAAIAKVAKGIRIDCTQPCRLRLYATVADQVADALRPSTSPPPPGAGCLFESLTIPALLGYTCSPPVLVVNDESTITNLIAYNLQPTTAVATTATLTYTVDTP